MSKVKTSTTKNSRKGEGSMQLEVFKNEEFGEVRVVEINSEPWFVGKDVATALGYSRPTKAIQDRVDIEDKDEVPIQDSIGRKQKTPIINESGLYSLILSSKLESAKRFKRWVTSEVLPSIRKTGSYGLPQISEKDKLALQILNSTGETERLKALCLYTEAVERPLLDTIEEQEEVIELQKPKVHYVDTILQNSSLVNISQIAKDYGMSGQALNKKLNELKVQYKQSGQWLLYSKYQDKGYTHSKTSNLYDTVGIDKVVMSTKWTQKGRLFLYELLKKNGILPVVERLNISQELERFTRPYSKDKSNFFIDYDIDADTLIAVEETPNYINPFKLYFESEEDIERAIQSIGEERLKEYLKKVVDK